MPKITVHLNDDPPETYIEVGDQRVEVEAAQYACGESGLCAVTLYLAGVEVVDKRAGMKDDK